jgi:hypothetical protein
MSNRSKDRPLKENEGQLGEAGLAENHGANSMQTKGSCGQRSKTR